MNPLFLIFAHSALIIFSGCTGEFPPMATLSTTTAQQAAVTMEALFEISELLGTGLDRTTLSILTSLCECGVDPEALAAAVKDLRKQSTMTTPNTKDGQ